MKAKFLPLLLLLAAAFSAHAQDPAVAGINPGMSPLMIDQTTIIEADILNGSSTAIPMANNATWTINLPPNVEVVSVTMDDPATSAFLSIYVSPYDPTGTTIQIVSDQGNFPGSGAYIAYITVKGKTLTAPGVPAPMSINAASFPPVGTNNSGNDNATSNIVIIPAATTPPVATDDSKSIEPNFPTTLTVLTNDTPGSSPIDPTSVLLIDPADGQKKTTVTIPGEGTYTVNTTTGEVTFDPEDFVQNYTSTIQYTIKGTDGQESPPATITINVGPLPVKLARFNAAREGNTSQLSWTTTEEVNSDRFEVEHSVGGKIWNKIGAVASHGESMVTNYYSFADKNPVNGVNLYRLKMIDKDLTFAYSKIEAVKFEGLGADLSIYPNPVTDVLSIRDFTQVSNVTITDVNGRSVLVSGQPAEGVVNVRNLKPGMYVVRVTRSNGTVSSHKVIRK